VEGGKREGERGRSRRDGGGIRGKRKGEKGRWKRGEGGWS